MIRRRVLPLLAAALAAVLVRGAPTEDVHEEYQVKAAYLFNFAKFIDWPAGAFATPHAPLVLCIAGRDPFGAALVPYERRLVHGRELRIRRNVPLPEIRACHLLYVSDSEERRLVAILAAVAGAPVVAVSDIDGFIDAGGTIGLVEADARIQFEVNVASAAAGQLRMSSQLLRLARRTRGGA